MLTLVVVVMVVDDCFSSGPSVMKVEDEVPEVDFISEVDFIPEVDFPDESC